jgi:hypothetical protein
VSDNGKLERPTQSPAGTTVAQPASAEAPVGQGLREGAGYHAVLAERAQAIESIRYRVTRGASGTPPAGHIAAERRAIIGAAAARIMRKQSGSATGGQVPQTTGAPLPADVKAKMEPKLGADLSSVKIHTNFGARAFTVGNDIHFNAGQFAPGSKATSSSHTRSRMQGQVSGVQRKAEDVDDAHGNEAKVETEVSEPSDAAEVEADQVSERVTDEIHEEKETGGKEKPGHATEQKAPGVGGVGRKTVGVSATLLSSSIQLAEDKNAADKLTPPQKAKAAKLRTPRGEALKQLLKEAAAGGIIIHSDAEANAYLDWAAKVQGIPPESMHACTLGTDIFVRPAYANDVRVLREEMIHVKQQQAGAASNEIVDKEIAARTEMIANRLKWGITNAEVREMIREIRQMRKTGKY